MRVVLGEVVGIDLAARAVELRPVADEPAPRTMSYDSLIVAGGSHYTYFGHDDWRQGAAGLKTLEGALAILRQVLAAFEAGVEMAGQMAEIARDVRRDFRSLDANCVRVLLLDAGDLLLKEFPAPLSAEALRALSRLDVRTLLHHPVVDIDARSVTARRPDGSLDPIAARTVVWGPAWSRRGSRAPSPRAPDLSLPGHPASSRRHGPHALAARATSGECPFA